MYSDYYVWSTFDRARNGIGPRTKRLGAMLVSSGPALGDAWIGKRLTAQRYASLDRLGPLPCMFPLVRRMCMARFHLLEEKTVQVQHRSIDKDLYDY